MRSDRDLYTPEMDQAERELNARANYALDLGRGLAEKAAQLDQRFDEKEPPSDEDVERMKKYILGHAMTEQWRQVVTRIDRGELTWREIVDGLFHGTLDREVSAAFRSLSRVPPASVEELVQLGVLPTLPPDRPTTAESRTTATRPDDDDDEWFEDPLRRRTR
ncbi:hypothetical protein [Saccharothrix luteola]|uniref:hypothetical protein n=1 Tax=Saccharothrix luteola TaxID=2893018 RepID=UPI001E4C1B2C|nr:hypothetical protein [Saccharothrix luteola]MCC8244983.1 hypothetical protein [Saccharothrix luteola]